MIERGNEAVDDREVARGKHRRVETLAYRACDTTHIDGDSGTTRHDPDSLTYGDLLCRLEPRAARCTDRQMTFRRQVERLDNVSGERYEDGDRIGVGDRQKRDGVGGESAVRDGRNDDISFLERGDSSHAAVGLGDGRRRGKAPGISTGRWRGGISTSRWRGG